MNRIKQLRELNNMTQQDLADKLDKAKSTIAMYENETRKPSLKVLNQLAEIFDVSIDYLLGLTNTDDNIKDNEIDIAFYEGYKDLNEEDKEILRNTLKAFLRNKGEKK